MPETIRPAELSFFSLADRLARISAQGDPLERLDGVTGWAMFRPVLDRALPPAKAEGPGGRPAHDRLLLCRILVLQRFLGLSLADRVPDQNTVREFREALQQAGAFQARFDVFREHLAARGLLPQEGVIVDASFVGVPRQRNTRAANAAIKAGQTPEDWSAKKRAHKDVDARWTKKDAQTFYGYKDHIKVSLRTKLIEAATVTAASVHDRQAIGGLVLAGDVVVFGDSAYTGQPVEAQMAAKGVDPVIVRKGVRGRELTEAEKAENRAISSTRARVEHPFAVMSGQAGRIFLRYIGRARNEAAVQPMNLCYNLRRYETLVRLKLHPLTPA